MGWDEIPEHLQPPEPSTQTRNSLSLWGLVQDQLRTTGTGHAFALDAPAVLHLLEKHGVEEPLKELKRMKIIFSHLYKQK